TTINLLHSMENPLRFSFSPLYLFFHYLVSLVLYPFHHQASLYSFPHLYFDRSLLYFLLLYLSLFHLLLDRLVFLPLFHPLLPLLHLLHSLVPLLPVLPPHLFLVLLAVPSVVVQAFVV